MSKHSKTLASIHERPLRNDIRWDDVVSLLDHYGYREKPGNGSRRKFYNEEKDSLIAMHEPHPRSTIKTYAVKDLSIFLKENNIL